MAARGINDLSRGNFGWTFYIVDSVNPVHFFFAIATPFQGLDGLQLENAPGLNVDGFRSVCLFVLSINLFSFGFVPISEPFCVLGLQNEDGEKYNNFRGRLLPLAHKIWKVPP